MVLGGLPVQVPGGIRGGPELNERLDAPECRGTPGDAGGASRHR
jgi:hypothetical protein